MPSGKYYNYAKNRPLDLEADGCALDKWQALHGDFYFARDPKGFLIFLSPERIAVSDEYVESDPYGVELNFDGDFQSRRVELTIDLVREALLQVSGVPKILDLGCGEGHITEAVRKAIGQANFSGLDYSVSAIKKAHDAFGDIEFIVGDAYHAPYAEDFFDVVICNNIWEHVPDPLALLNRVSKIIKPGGFLAISTPSRYRVANLVRVLRGKPINFMSQHHVTEYTVGQVKEQLAFGGFAVKRVSSRPLQKSGLKTKLAKCVISLAVSMVGSHHQLESTVFYLAQKRTAAPKNKMDNE